MAIKIYNNFLDAETHANLYATVQSIDIPWYKNVVVQPPLITEDVQFVHELYANHNVISNFYNTFTPIFDKLNVQLFHRVKLNLTLKQEEKRILGGYHTDWNVNGAPFKELKIAIYYFNTTNGETVIKENGKINTVNCVENSLVTFSNKLEHTAMTHTDTSFRYVLNINYV
tara:strand:- start:88 stop:600 length:513 start_codon:yes stop_codon:yes gene_type:complete